MPMTFRARIVGALEIKKQAEYILDFTIKNSIYQQGQN